MWWFYSSTSDWVSLSKLQTEGKIVSALKLLFLTNFKRVKTGKKYLGQKGGQKIRLFI